ncbi:ABC transporter substrate-binding protein [Conexibacter woesei]|uniref:Extracellular ligand-binding receptor n=1 Tax=Conexibacter woesei (strain DSM 14684 / CCUG 47730 / CIP 108061 / JCM 11494 / NBRC 100937 / ID131577) TaxID=469383 RepID=D3F592_CONWI|nr:ABC transporter substrate-binding protein [Conexibacter woesei]ADB50559.1 Extracellular ligand-binding receptor [Conexibacter woesei DSM 14684]
MKRKVAMCAWLAVVGVLVMTTAGCGSSNDGDGDGGAAGKTVNIGAIGAFSGLAGAAEGTPHVLEAWAETVNAAGGLDGHDVRVIVEDIGATTGAGRAAVQKLIEEDDVVAVFSQDFNDATWVKYAESRSVPVISGIAGVTTLTSSDVFPITLSPITLGYGLDAELKKVGDTGAVGYQSGIALNEQIVALMRSFSEPVGLSLPVVTKMSPSLPDYTAFCQQVKDSGAASYFVSFGASVATKITEQCVQQGVRIPQLLVGLFADKAWKTNSAYDGAVVLDGAAPFFDTSVPGVKEYRDALGKYAPDFSGSSQDSSYGLFAWAGMQMIATAAAKARGPITNSSLQAALYTIKDETLGGIVPPLTYTKGKANPIHCWFTWTIANGEFVATNDAKPTCAPDAVVAPAEAALAKSLAG